MRSIRSLIGILDTKCGIYCESEKGEEVLNSLMLRKGMEKRQK